MTLHEREYALQLDARDPLHPYRERFASGDPEMIYMDGNSLGRLPIATATLAEELVQHQWGERLIRSWNEGWFTAPERIGGKIAGMLGADPDEVIVADATSVNLFKLVVAALRLQAGRSQVVTDDLNFPSDLYILQGVIELLDKQHHLEVVASSDAVYGPVDELLRTFNEQTALVTLSHTVFKSGYVYDMAALTAAAHAVGSLVLWDLSHSVGALPVHVHEANVDMAIGCTYKYVNGGPGAPAFLYIRRDLQERLKNPLTGWMGQRDLFAFDLAYQPAIGLRSWLTGTPPVISLSLIEPGVDLLTEVGIAALREKSLQQSAYLIELWQAFLEPLGFQLNSPREDHLRGSHVSLGHPEGLRIDQALIHDMHVLPDFRAPSNIRLGITPLYTTFSDVYDTVMALRQIVVEKIYEKYSAGGLIVT